MHPDRVLGVAPSAGAPEKLVAHRAASDALGLTEPQQLLRESSDGILQARQLAYQREVQWAPADVTAQLEAASIAAADAQAQAVIAGKQGDMTESMDDADGQYRKASEARALADEQAARKAELEQVHRAHLAWLAETTFTRQSAQDAAAELGRRYPDQEPASPLQAPVSRSQTAEDRAADIERARQAEDEIAARHAAEHEADRDVADEFGQEPWQQVQAEREADPWQAGLADFGQGIEQAEPEARMVTECTGQIGLGRKRKLLRQQIHLVHTTLPPWSTFPRLQHFPLVRMNYPAQEQCKKLTTYHPVVSPLPHLAYTFEHSRWYQADMPFTHQLRGCPRTAIGRAEVVAHVIDPDSTLCFHTAMW